VAKAVPKHETDDRAWNRADGAADHEVVNLFNSPGF